MQAQLLSKVSSLAMCGSLLLAVPTHGISYTTSIDNKRVPSENQRNLQNENWPASNVHVYKSNIFAYTMRKTKKIVPNTIILNEEVQKPVLQSGKRTVDVLPSEFSVLPRKPILEVNAWKESNEEMLVKRRNVVDTIQSTFTVTTRKSRPLA
ncbi:hypothetical protein J1907_17705 [Lysinibacillus sphaericus]|uniref:hypothetical protein n=1 Tax=Lysinibacillus sphaericus TaxID=1421 RepID=UPI00056D31E3|nr:hypothetical protein [Lysinibacillus sphaericus]QTB21561.1 hypothetical protein J1907_17705 [Lysinibacillus sphaericus]